MSKKRLHSRLDHLVSNLFEEEAAAPKEPVVAPSTEPAGLEKSAASLDETLAAPVKTEQEQLCGWTWEIDAQGNFTFCSAEAGSSIGVPAEQMQGQPILAFRLHEQSSKELKIALEKSSFPVEQDVFYLDADNLWLPARVHILKRTENGWQGFTQMLPPGASQPPDGAGAPIAEAAPAIEAPRPPQPEVAPQPAPEVRDEQRTIPFKKKANLPTTGSLEGKLPPEGGQAGKTPSTGALAWSRDAHGFSLVNGVISPSNRIWTDAGEESLGKKEAVFTNATEEKPATIAIPFEMQGIGDLLLEVLDEGAQREWNDDDRFMVMEIVGQLALALDNAQLYISVQQELAERVRVEQAILRRNRDLSTLNRIGQQLSHLATRDEIFTLLSEMIGQVVGNQNMYICTYNPTRHLLSFAVYNEDGAPQVAPDLPLGNGIPEYVIQNKQPLLIGEKVEAKLEEMGIEAPYRMPRSLLAIPLVTGERIIGAVVVQDFEKENAFDNIHLELLSTATSQATTAIENADLFQQMQGALSALENRERYQSNVAKAAAILTEFGTKALPEVLKTLSAAAQCNRIYFAQIKQDERGLFWAATAEWVDPAVAYMFDKNRMLHIPADTFAHWSESLRTRGWTMTVPGEEYSEEADFLQGQHIRSSLLLAVPGTLATPSYLAFDQVSSNRVWQSEEINALRVAADAITNTFVREDLMNQLQVSLEETENLYKSSNRLALANDMQEMVGAVMAGVRAPGVNRAVLLLFEIDNFGKITQIRVGANWYNGRGTPPPPVGTDLVRARFEHFLQTQSPLFYEDILEAQIDTDVRMSLLEQNIRGLGVLPLLTGKRQTGTLLVEAEGRHVFTGRETRTYPPLADQMAIAVENQRLFEQTQKALSETELLYTVSNRIAQAADAKEMLELVVGNVMPTGTDQASIMLINLDENDELASVELVGFQDANGAYQQVGAHMPISEFGLARALTDEPLIIADTARYPIDPASKRSLDQFDIQAACLVPLRTSGRLIGVLTASARRPIEFEAEETRLLRIVGNGIAVSLEKQRLLRQAQRRALELQTASEIARDTTSTLSLDLLLNRIVNMLSERFDFYHASIFLLDETGTYAQVRESTGEAGKEMKRRGHRLEVGSRSVVGTTTATGEPFIINDVNLDSTHLPNPLLPNTRSEMGIPLKISNKVIGAVDLQAETVNAFSQDDVTVLQILSDQIAIAIENARAYELSQRAIADMKEVDRVKSQFLANMSHELRTPLNSIIGFSRVILKGIDGPVNDTQKQDLNAIYNSGQHLLSLINDILDLSKIEAGKMELAFADVNLVDMINSVMSTATGLVKDKAVKLKTIVPDNLPIVRADQTRVRQVLINFLSNAAKFTEEGEIVVEASIILSPKTKKPEVMLAVTDSGPGIAQQDQAKLFLPFSQVDDSPTRKTGGTGLGLSICRSLIEMHGGRIGLLRSDVGVGSTFFFTLPVNAPVPAPEAETSSNPGSNVILAIDDDIKVINLYERYLRPHGYQVLALTNPKEAVARAKEARPFAITLDIMMPGKDGWQVMNELKNDPETREIPIVICSILESQEKGFSMGAADYLVKPFLQEDLINAINRLNRDGQIKEIMVIDDDPADLRLLQKIIEDSHKFHAVLAEGGVNGWEAVQAKKPDAIILDLFMPEMNGFELLAKLRENESLRQVPVIVLTGADLTPDQHQQLSEFGQGMMTKGFLREKDLLLMLEETLKKFQTVAAD